MVTTNLLAYASAHLLSHKYPTKQMMFISGTALLTTICLSLIPNVPFLYKALPLSFGSAAPLIHISWLFLFSQKKESSLIMKIEAVVLVLMAIHSLNFALFRLDPSTQLWGWLISYACYQSLTTILPVLSLEFYHSQEKKRLKDKIAEKTKHLRETNEKLNTVLVEKTFLVRALVHDVSNPLTVILVKSKFLKKTEDSAQFINSIQEMAEKIQKIITHIINFERFNNTSSVFKGKKCNFKDVLDETIDMFSEKIKNKSLSTEIKDQSAVNNKQNIELEIDSVVFMNSVLANFISNAIKFSKRYGVIGITYEYFDDELKFKIVNHGVGMNKVKIKSLYKFDTNETQLGTEGEQGTGFGIPVANQIVQKIGGTLIIRSNDEKRIGPIYTEMEVKIPCVTGEKLRQAG